MPRTKTSWQPGQSGNPRGKPKANAELEALFRESAPVAAERLHDLLHSNDEEVALKAAIYVTNRVLGTPKEHVDVGAAGDLATFLAKALKSRQAEQ